MCKSTKHCKPVWNATERTRAIFEANQGRVSQRKRRGISSENKIKNYNKDKIENWLEAAWRRDQKQCWQMHQNVTNHKWLETCSLGWISGVKKIPFQTDDEFTAWYIIILKSFPREIRKFNFAFDVNTEWRL